LTRYSCLTLVGKKDNGWHALYWQLPFVVMLLGLIRIGIFHNIFDVLNVKLHI